MYITYLFPYRWTLALVPFFHCHISSEECLTFMFYMQDKFTKCKHICRINSQSETAGSRDMCGCNFDRYWKTLCHKDSLNSNT